MSRTIPLVLAMAIAFPPGAPAAQPAAPPEAGQPPPAVTGDLAALRNKLREKHALARKLFDESSSEVERGLVEPGDLLIPSQALLTAELQNSTTPAEQIKAHERHLAVLKRCEAHFQRRFEQRRVPFQTYAQVQLARMDEEIAILELKTHLPPPKRAP
jgi:hypothetical protein